MICSYLSIIFVISFKNLEYLQGETSELHIDIRRIGINEIPNETNEQISNWLYQRFSLKDK